MRTLDAGRALIATHNLVDYAGSEVLTLELATELGDMGWQVLVAAMLSGDPMLTEFRKRGIEVVDLLEPNPAIDKTEFDLAWIHHTPVFNELFVARQTKAAKVVFCSLSHFEPLESVPACTEGIDLLVAHSIENKHFIVNERNLNEDRVLVFPNAAPGPYWVHPKGLHNPLTRLAIVSNHPPAEVLRAAEILAPAGLDVVRIGMGGDPLLMSPDVLRDCDAVITVGKTVPYCFALKVPVYCYDRFGGPGWLTTDNMDLAGQNNFSGRGFEMKTADTIAQEIMEGYQASLLGLDAFRDHAANHHHLRRNLEQLLRHPGTRSMGQPDCVTAQTLRHHAQYMRLARSLRATLSVRDAQLEARGKEISRIKSTRSWRFTAPFRAAHNFLRALRKR